MKAFMAVVILVVVASIIAGLVLSGPPSVERRRQFDERRSEDLQSIAAAIDVFASERGRVPLDLSELTTQGTPQSPQSIFDPRTSQPYEYVATDTLAYQLCATFETDVRAAATLPGKAVPRRMAPLSRFQNHSVGRTCYVLVAHKRATPND